MHYVFTCNGKQQRYRYACDGHIGGPTGSQEKTAAAQPGESTASIIIRQEDSARQPSDSRNANDGMRVWTTPRPPKSKSEKFYTKDVLVFGNDPTGTQRSSD